MKTFVAIIQSHVFRLMFSIVCIFSFCCVRWPCVGTTNQNIFFQMLAQLSNAFLMFWNFNVLRNCGEQAFDAAFPTPHLFHLTGADKPRPVFSYNKKDPRQPRSGHYELEMDPITSARILARHGIFTCLFFEISSIFGKNCEFWFPCFFNSSFWKQIEFEKSGFRGLP